MPERRGRAAARGLVHYLSYYVAPGDEGRRTAVPAGQAKIEYVRDVLEDAGFRVRLVSAAASRGLGSRGWGHPTGRGGEVRYLPSLAPGGRLGHAVLALVGRLQVLWYLLTRVRRGDTVLVYHSLAFVRPLTLATRLRHFRFVLELNDVYSAVSSRHRSAEAKELAFVATADAHLFMNRIAQGRFGGGRPSVVSYGAYVVPEGEPPRPEARVVRAVYAGIVEPGRRAAELAVEAAAHVGDDVEVHVLGFGADAAIADLRAQVAAVNTRAGRRAVTFHGQLRGEEFSDFLRTCDIGISSHAYRDDEQESADLTFPSKIPVYMTHGLRVVSPSIPCVVDSPFAELTEFYDDHEPSAIAAAIDRCARRPAGGRTPRDLVAALDRDFRAALPTVVAGEHGRR